MTQREFEIGFCHKRTSVCTGFFIDENHLITRLDSKTRRKKGLFVLTDMRTPESDEGVFFQSVEELLSYKVDGLAISEYVAKMESFNLTGDF